MSEPTLFIVATPIGNLADLSPRAVEVLKTVDLIAAEDTRHSQRLMTAFGIKTKLMALHQHNEREASENLIRLLQSGKNIALISDAGTPCISDPGQKLVATVAAQNYNISPIPGPCAFIAALSVSGLNSDHFTFIGFLPSKAGARQKQLEHLKANPETLIFYEAPHRIMDSLEAMKTVFGAERSACVGREITKSYETFYRGNLEMISKDLSQHPEQHKGEFVVMIEGAKPRVESEISTEVERILNVLRSELPLKQACQLASEITGVKKNRLYAFALSL